MDAELIALICIFVGVVVRMLIPAMRKRKQALDSGEPWEWDHRYTFTALFSLVIAIASTLIGFMAYPIPEEISIYYFVIGAVVYGFGLNAVITEVSEWTI